MDINELRDKLAKEHVNKVEDFIETSFEETYGESVYYPGTKILTETAKRVLQNYEIEIRNEEFNFEGGCYSITAEYGMKKRKPNNHELKILPGYYIEVVRGAKTFEIRKNDRDFRVGDYILLKEWDEQNGYSGNSIDAEITYITNYEQVEQFVVFSFMVLRIN